MQEFAYFSQIAGTGTGLLQTAVVVCFFIAVLFGEKRIRYPALFRLACFLLILSIVIPPIAGPMLAPILGGSRSGMGQGPWAMMLILSAGPVLLGASLFLAFGSLTIGSTSRNPLPRSGSPKKHPLDD